jgi:hypothetical protein
MNRPFIECCPVLSQAFSIGGRAAAGDEFFDPWLYTPPWPPGQRARQNRRVTPL